MIQGGQCHYRNAVDTYKSLGRRWHHTAKPTRVIPIWLVSFV